MQLPVGISLVNPTRAYRIGKAIGSGGFGQTYLAKDRNAGGIVAIKEYFPKRCNLHRRADYFVEPEPRMANTYREGMGSFIKEATMLLALSGIESIVHILDYFEAFGTAYMVMDFVYGKTLRSVVEHYGRIDPTALLRAMVPLMHDIDILNKAGVVHRDIAPDNIILTPSGTLKLVDFGCARSMEDGRSMEVMLKPGFAPVEQYNRHGQGTFTDVYGLCASIYYSIARAIPVDASKRAFAIGQGKPDPLVTLSNQGVAVSEGVEKVLMDGLRIFPNDRIQTMGELAYAFETALKLPHPYRPSSQELVAGFRTTTIGYVNTSHYATTGTGDQRGGFVPTGSSFVTTGSSASVPTGAAEVAGGDSAKDKKVEQPPAKTDQSSQQAAKVAEKTDEKLSAKTGGGSIMGKGKYTLTILVIVVIVIVGIVLIAFTQCSPQSGAYRSAPTSTYEGVDTQDNEYVEYQVTNSDGARDFATTSTQQTSDSSSPTRTDNGTMVRPKTSVTQNNY